MYKSYGPYAGCFDGALEKVDDLLDWAYESGLTVLLDVHAIKDSQNGFDNSGQAMGFKWTTALNSEFAGDVSFEHWPIRSARWMGEFDPETAGYPKINRENIQHALDVVTSIVDRYGGHPAVLGLEPVNEPWQYTPIEELKKFYWEGYLIVKKAAPYWKYIMHDSFRFDPAIWGGFMDGCPERALDTHIYQAWRDPDSRIGFYYDACAQKAKIATMEREFGPVIVGEWSLATDNCAMWLNGFNDNLPGFPRLPCKYIPCGNPYMGSEQPGAPVDNTKAIQGPFGTGMSGPHFGLCPVSRDWLKESSGNPQTGHDWVRAPPEAPKHLDDTDHVMTHLAYKKISAFSGIGHGFYFWNFRTDVEEPHWSYILALEKGWIPKGNLNDEMIQNACLAEDSFEYKCVLKHDVAADMVKSALDYILGDMNETATSKDYDVLGFEGTDLFDRASTIISDYFESHKGVGATCDFGGIAMLVEVNRTITDDDYLGWDDDEYGGVVYEGPDVLVIVLSAVLCIILGSIVGFFVSMHCNRKFNEKVRESKYFRRVSSSQNNLVRRSFALPNVENTDELARLIRQQDMPGKMHL
jgi:glucan 1,3-beta-glucosidase